MTWLACSTEPATFNISNPIPEASMPVIPDDAVTAAEVSWETAAANTSTRSIAPGTVVGTLPGSSISTQPMSTAPVSSSTSATSKSSASSNFRIQSFDGGIGMAAGVLLSIAWVLMSR